ncbi:hypothetical protein FRC04_007624 [Tulasnella sp. 424]|nr:hypothetical protein FRC04_007624 [Tulasnella sp. 424]KAG8979057.1 hypothetical protein FRC05_009267 [Tulasnella sp. 425]
MHPVLAIPEILLQIFGDLAGPTGWQDLARCAQVCTAFRGPAMELLWNGSTALPFYAVLSLFPRDLMPLVPLGSGRSRVGPQGFIRRPCPRDWREIILRSPKIRKLFHSEVVTHHEDVQLLEVRTTLCPGRQAHFFPRPQLPRAFFQSLAFHSSVPINQIFSNLKELEWTSNDLDCCLPLISDSIERLSLCSEDFELGFFQELEARMPAKALKEIRFMGKVPVADPRHQMGEECVNDLQSFLVGCNQLRRVVLDRHFASTEILTVLSTLERVEYLEITGTLYEGMLEASLLVAQTTGAAMFPALQELVITLNSRSLPFFKDPQSITSGTFSTFKVTYNGNSADHLRELFAIIADRWPELRILHIHPPPSFYNFIEGDAKMKDLYQKPERVARIARSFITGEIIKPLLGLSALEELVVEWPYPARLENRVLKDMVASWPYLRCLYLTPIPYVILPERPLLHFEDLAVFRQSEHLEQLAIFMDATYPRPTTRSKTKLEADVSTLSISGRDRSQCTSLLLFDPGYSWINYPHIVVSRFKRMFPNAFLPKWRYKDSRSRWGDVACRVWDTL